VLLHLHQRVLLAEVLADQGHVARDDAGLVGALTLPRERVEGLVEDPGAAERAAADHHGGAPSLGRHPPRLLHRAHVAVTGDRHAHRVHDFPDDGPRGLTGEALRARARVHGDGVHALGLRHLGHLDRVQVLVVPAAADLDGERHAHRLAQRAQDERGGGHVAHERGALALAGDLGHGAAHIEIHDVGAQDLAALGGPREPIGILAQELHGERPLRGIVGGDGVGVRVAGQERGRVHLLRGGEPAAALPRDEPEGRIGDAGHRGQAGQRGDLDGTDLHGRPSIRAQGRRGPAHRPR